MTYHLTGYPAIIVVLLAILGAATILTGIQNWASERVYLDLHPLWHVIPRRFKIRLRWDRPGANFEFDGGRQGVILGAYHADDVDQALLIQPCAADLAEADGPPEWVACSNVDGEWKSLTGLPVMEDESA